VVEPSQVVDDGYEFSISGAAFHACGFIAGSWTMSLQLLKLLDVERLDDFPPFHAGRFFPSVSSYSC